MGTSIPFADLAGLLARIPDAALGDPGLGPALGRGAMERSFPIALGPAGAGVLTAELASEVSLFAFDSADDADADGVLRPPAAPGLPPPPLTLAPGRAWIKTRVEMSADAAAGASGDLVGFELRAGARLVLCDYHAFPRGERARAAVASALAATRFAVRLDDVLELAPGEAVSLRLAGALSATVSVRWADVFAGQISLLRRFVPEGEILPVKISAAAEIDATLRIQDEFLLVFSREEAGARYRVSARKARARHLGAAPGLSVEVEFRNPEQVERAASAVVESLLGAAEARVRHALSRAVAGVVDAEDAAILEAVRRRLGVADPAALTARIDDLAREMAESVRRIARSELEAGFRYEYQRVEQDAAVLGMVMDTEGLREHHEALVRARFGPVLEAIRRGDSHLALESFLGRKELRISRGWGFSLGFGRWSASGKDGEEIRAVEQRDAAGRKRVSYQGLRKYQGSWGGQAFEWAGDFGASMDRFSTGAVPLVSDFAFGVHLLWRSGTAALGERSLRELLDTALLWEVFPQHALPEVTARLRGALGGPAELVTQMRLDDAQVRAVLGARALGDPLALAAPLAAAMPWLAGEPGREDVVVRRSLYAPLWAEYLKQPRAKPDAFGRVAEGYLRKSAKQPGLASRERNCAASRANTFAGLIELNPGTEEAWRRFRGGLERLRDATSRPTPDEGVVGEVFRALSGLWTQSLHLRASGALLLDHARAAGVLDGVERTLTVAYADEAVVIGA